MLSLFAFFLPRKNAERNTRLLHRKSDLIGMQSVLVNFLLYTVLAVYMSDHTTISRFRYDYATLALYMSGLMTIVTIFLGIDSVYSISDLRAKTNLTTSRFYFWLSEARPWLLFISGLWFLILMSVCEIEQTWSAYVPYFIFFVGGACLFLFVALRDGCVDNRMQQQGTSGRSEEQECISQAKR